MCVCVDMFMCEMFSLICVCGIFCLTHREAFSAGCLYSTLSVCTRVSVFCVPARVQTFPCVCVCVCARSVEAPGNLRKVFQSFLVARRTSLSGYQAKLGRFLLRCLVRGAEW